MDIEQKKETSWQLKPFVAIGGLVLVLALITAILPFFAGNSKNQQVGYFDTNQASAVSPCNFVDNHFSLTVDRLARTDIPTNVAILFSWGDKAPSQCLNINLKLRLEYKNKNGTYTILKEVSASALQAPDRVASLITTVDIKALDLGVLKDEQEVVFRASAQDASSACSTACLIIDEQKSATVDLRDAEPPGGGGGGGSVSLCGGFKCPSDSVSCKSFKNANGDTSWACVSSGGAEIIVGTTPAGGGTGGGGGGTGDNGGGTDDLPGIDLTIDDIFNIIYGFSCWLWSVSMFIIVIAIIWVGLRMVTAQANPTAFTSAKTAFKNVLLGAIVIMGVYVIIATVANSVGVDISLIPFSCSAPSDNGGDDGGGGTGDNGGGGSDSGGGSGDENVACETNSDCESSEVCFFGQCTAKNASQTTYQLCGSSAVSGNAGNCIVSSDCDNNFCYDASGNSVCASAKYPSSSCRRDKNGNPIP